MSTIQRYLVLPAALVAMIAMSSTVAAQCDSKGSAQGPVASTHGWPSASGCQNCSAGSAGGHALAAGGFGIFHQFSDSIERYKADAALVQARGSAWPMPFNCWDREHYQTIFNQQYAHGLQTAHMLNTEYFNAETNELNRAGESRVAWIMQNAPAAEKLIFIYEDETAPTLDQRISNIRQFTERYYGHLGDVQIAKSQIKPNMIPATYQAESLRLYNSGQPVPVIPVDVGSTISGSVGN